MAIVTTPSLYLDDFVNRRRLSRQRVPSTAEELFAEIIQLSPAQADLQADAMPNNCLAKFLRPIDLFPDIALMARQEIQSELAASRLVVYAGLLSVIHFDRQHNRLVFSAIIEVRGSVHVLLSLLQKVVNHFFNILYSIRL